MLAYCHLTSGIDLEFDRLEEGKVWGQLTDNGLRRTTQVRTDKIFYSCWSPRNCIRKIRRILKPIRTVFMQSYSAGGGKARYGV